jgi:HPt (histidine-containing phosphotransfer) domain-containing protein
MEAREMRLRISTLTAAKDKLEKTCQQLQTELDSRGSELKETINQLQKDLAAVRGEKDKLVGKLMRDHKVDKANMKSEIDRLAASVAELKDEVCLETSSACSAFNLRLAQLCLTVHLTIH